MFLFLSITSDLEGVAEGDLQVPLPSLAGSHTQVTEVNLTREAFLRSARSKLRADLILANYSNGPRSDALECSGTALCLEDS